MNPSHNATLNAIIIHRANIEKLVARKKNVRDQLIIDLPRLQGFRTGEVSTLRWEYVDFNREQITVLDSKKHILVTLPLHWRVARLLEKYRRKSKSDGWVIRPLESWNIKHNDDKPITSDTLQNVVKWYAEEAGIPDWHRYNPTLLRAYFAADWVSEKRSLKILQTLMRHNDLPTTLHYVGRIVFWEDMEAEFHRIQRVPKPQRRTEKTVSKILENPVAKQCMNCPANIVCKHVGEAVASEWATGCRLYPKILKRVSALKISEVIQQ